MADVFISYSRKDKDLVRALHDALKAHNRDTWVDWEDIPPTAEWLKEIFSAIDAAHTFIFVITSDSVASEICKQEIAHAVKYHSPWSGPRCSIHTSTISRSNRCEKRRAGSALPTYRGFSRPSFGRMLGLRTDD